MDAQTRKRSLSFLTAATVVVAGLTAAVTVPAAAATVTATVAVGNAPFAVATAPDSSKAYVANSAGNSVSVIDLSTNAVTATIAVGAGPLDLAATPNGSRVYVANSTGNSVSVINTATNAVVTTIPVAGTPAGVAVTPDSNKVLVSRAAANKVSTISTATNTVTSEVAVGAVPRGVAVGPDGARAYVANSGTNTVSIINLASNTVTATVTVGAGPFGVTVGADGKAYVASIAGNSVSVIGTGDTVLATIPVPGTPVFPRLSQDGATLYVTRFALNALGIVRLSDNSITGNLAVGTNPIGLAVTADGTRAVTANRGTNNASVVALAPKAITNAATAVDGDTATGNGKVTSDTDAVTSVKCLYATSLAKLNGGVPAGAKSVNATPNTVAASSSKDVTCNMTGLTRGTQFFYRVVATDTDGTAGQVDAATFLTVPKKVPSPDITTKKKKIRLDWNDVVSATSYQARIKPKGGSFNSWKTFTASKRKFTNLSRHTTYKMKLRALNDTGHGVKRVVTATTR